MKLHVIGKIKDAINARLFIHELRTINAVKDILTLTH